MYTTSTPKTCTICSFFRVLVILTSLSSLVVAVVEKEVAAWCRYGLRSSVDQTGGGGSLESAVPVAPGTLTITMVLVVLVLLILSLRGVQERVVILH